MFNIFKDSLKNYLKLDKIRTDNTIFTLHYKFTVALLLAFSLLVSKKQYFGDPIDCIVEELNTDTIDMYCWIQSTYSIPELIGAKVGEEVAHPGVAPHAKFRNNSTFHLRQHKYYQWVVLFLVFQAWLFYLPRYLWTRFEAGRMQTIIGELHMPLLEPEVMKQRLNIAIEYFGRYFHHHNMLAYQFFTCEILNFVNVLGQLYFTDKFLGTGFLDYGPRVLNYIKDENKHDPKDEIFPKVTKCAFHKFGPSGSIIRHDALCVLPLNVLNEKIYAFLWFWLVVLCVVTGLWLCYRVVTIFTPMLRHKLLRHHSRLASKDQVNIISHKCYVGDWLILCLIARNMDPFVYRDFISGVNAKLIEKESFRIKHMQ